MSHFKLTRRDLLKKAGILGGGLIIGLPLTACSSHYPNVAGLAGEQGLSPNVYLQITQDNNVNFYLSRSEMGQGTFTGLTTLIAEELDILPEDIHIHHAGADDAFSNPEFGMQVTGASSSIRTSYLPVRQAGADARALILEAASLSLNTPLDTLTTQNAQVIFKGQAYAYGSFVNQAATLSLPKGVKLKADSDFKFIGKDRPRLDALAKSTGTAAFGMDVEIDGLYRAALLRCPVVGGKVIALDDKAVRSLTGVKDVVVIHTGVAVVAEHYWQARQALSKLKVEWEIPEGLGQINSDALEDSFRQKLEERDHDTAIEEGLAYKGLAQANKVITADYWAPYLAHATMEPMNCTVRIENAVCDVWVGSQSPGLAAGLAAFYGGISKDKVTIHSRFLGGGFGRRAASDYVGEAAAIAKQTKLPIQLVWSREDDTRYDLYRPASLVRFEVGLDQAGRLDTWVAHRVGPNVMAYTLDEAFDAIAPDFLPNTWVDRMSKAGYSLYDGFKVDPFSIEGLYEDYDIPNKAVQHSTLDPGLPVGYWRSVGHSYSGFFKESMMDEIAIALAKDPVQFRLDHSQQDIRLTQVIERAAELANWPNASAPERYLGVAAHTSFSTSVAQIAEISIHKGEIRIHKVFCVIDCGRLVNPDMVVSQMESGIIFGLTAALMGEITIKNGAVEQSNFHDYPVLRMAQVPLIEVDIIKSDKAPTGVGEPGVPPIAAAVANAVFSATGKRLRRLPLKLT